MRHSTADGGRFYEQLILSSLLPPEYNLMSNRPVFNSLISENVTQSNQSANLSSKKSISPKCAHRQPGNLFRI